MGNRNVVTRTARWSANHPWWALVVWIVFVGIALAVGGSTGTKVATNTDLSIGQSAQASAIARSGGLTQPPTEALLVTALHGGLDRQAADRAAADALSRLKSLPAVASTGQRVLSSNGQALLVPVVMTGDQDTAPDRVQPLVDAVRTAQRGNPAVRVELVGPDTVHAALNTILGEQVQQATLLSLPVTLLVMMFVCGAMVAAGVPVVLGLSSVLAGLGLWGAASQLVPDPGAVSELIVLMGMAVGVDYSLFYLKRFREERARGLGKVDAVELAAATSGHSVVVSGTVVILSMGALYLGGNLAFTAMATGSILVVAIAMSASLTVLPALLMLFGRALERPRVPLIWRLQSRGDHAGGVGDGPAHVEQFDITGQVTDLVVTTNHGNIAVRSSSGGTTKVTETVRYRSTKPTITSSHNGGTLTLKAGGCGSVLGANTTCSVDYSVEVPKGAKVNLRASAGDVALTGTAGGGDLHSEAGNIKADGVSGAVLTASTDGGDINLSFAAAPGSVKATSSAGDVTLHVPNGRYAVDASSDVGDSTVHVANDPSAANRLHLHSDAGNVSVLSTS